MMKCVLSLFKNRKGSPTKRIAQAVPSLLFEPLEPRLLLSADLNPIDAGELIKDSPYTRDFLDASVSAAEYQNRSGLIIDKGMRIDELTNQLTPHYQSIAVPTDDRFFIPLNATHLCFDLTIASISHDDIYRIGLDGQTERGSGTFTGSLLYETKLERVGRQNVKISIAPELRNEVHALTIETYSKDVNYCQVIMENLRLEYEITSQGQGLGIYGTNSSENVLSVNHQVQDVDKTLSTAIKEPNALLVLPEGIQKPNSHFVKDYYQSEDLTSNNIRDKSAELSVRTQIDRVCAESINEATPTHTVEDQVKIRACFGDEARGIEDFADPSVKLDLINRINSTEIFSNKPLFVERSESASDHIPKLSADDYCPAFMTIQEDSNELAQSASAVTHEMPITVCSKKLPAPVNRCALAPVNAAWVKSFVTQLAESEVLDPNDRLEVILPK
jgi:hypothetical protein